MTETIIKRNIIKSVAGSGSTTYRLSMSNKMIEVLGVTDEERTVDVILKNNQIIIKKSKDQDKDNVQPKYRTK